MRPSLLLAALLAASALSAATIDANFTGILTGESVVRTISNSTTGVQTPTTVGVGLLSYIIVPGGEAFYAYCIEPQQGAASSTYTIDPTLLTAPLNNGGISAAQANAVRLLLGQVSNPFDPGLSAITQAALQVGVWEIVRENVASTFNVSTGNVTFANASNAQILVVAQQLLDAVNNNVGTANNGVVALTSPTAQDVVTNLPEPSSFVMIGLSAVPVIFMVRRRKNNN